MSGAVLVIDKPRGPTSHDVVARLRRLLGTKHVGHCGTLDPMATGVLVVAIDDGTKLVRWLTTDDKTYEATIRLGVATDSLDADGIETARAPLPAALLDELTTMSEGALAPIIARAVEAERSRTLQIPPAISAIRIGGERAHDIARRGETPDLAAREVAVRRLEVVGGGIDPEPYLRVIVDVAKGYFVRSLARDLAEALGTLGHLTALRRTRSGAFTIDDAAPLDMATGKRADLEPALIPLDRAATRALPVSVLTPDGVTAAFHGQRLMPNQLRDPHAEPSAWLDEAGALIAVGEIEADGSGRVLRGFR